MANKEKHEQLIVIEKIEEKIFLIRGQKIMFDSDLAEIYDVETKMLNRAVKRNLSRFPEDFMFQLTDEETKSLRFQIGTSNTGRGGRRYLPYAFTEHGAVMLASVLNSPTAIEASIKVVRAFVKMRSILTLHQDLADRIKELEKVSRNHEQTFEVVYGLFSEILNDPKFLKRKIGFVEKKETK
ncbi:MAG: ORF6N domain-containing protein [Acidobacteriota bacterium]